MIDIIVMWAFDPRFVPSIIAHFVTTDIGHNFSVSVCPCMHAFSFFCWMRYAVVHLQECDTLDVTILCLSEIALLFLFIVAIFATDVGVHFIVSVYLIHPM